MRVLEWRETARADPLAIVDYISDDNPDAAQLLKDDIEARVAKLPEHPKLYRPGRVVGTREMVVRTNYVVVYTEDPRAVSILRVSVIPVTLAMMRLSRGRGTENEDFKMARAVRFSIGDLLDLLNKPPSTAPATK